MRRRQECKATMFNVVEDFLDNTSPLILNSVPKIKDYMDNLGSNIRQIQALREVQEQNVTGTAKLKKRINNTLVELALDVALRTRSYAINQKDTELENLIDYSKTNLGRSADTILRDKCQLIHDKTLDHLADLQEYGITSQLLEELKREIDNFMAILPKPRQKTTNKKEATKEIGLIIPATDELLVTMDKLLEMTKKNHSEFYRTYKNNRKIIDTGRRHLALIGKITDKKGNAIAKVTIKIEETQKSMLSGLAGQFRIKILESGTYHFIFNKNGYQEQTVKVEINDGERTTLKVVLEEVE